MEPLSIEMFNGNEFYVNYDNGSNNNSGTSWAQAKKTIAAAMNLVHAGRGDRVYLHGDQTWSEQVELKSGMALIGSGPNTVIWSNAGNQPMIKMKNACAVNSMAAFGHVLIQGLRLYNYSYVGTTGITIKFGLLDSQQFNRYCITVRDCVFKGVSVGLEINPGADPGGLINVLDNEFQSCTGCAISLNLINSVHNDNTYQSVGIIYIERNIFIGNELALNFIHGGEWLRNLPAGICVRNLFLQNTADVSECTDSGEYKFWFTENYWDAYLDDENQADDNEDGFLDGDPVPSEVQEENRRDHYAFANFALAVAGKMAFNKKMFPSS